MYSLICKFYGRTILFLVSLWFVIFYSGTVMAGEVEIVMKDWIDNTANFNAQIHAGDTVSWVNDDHTAHTITFDDGSIKGSNNLMPGSQFSITFDKPGEYSYHCMYHKVFGMKGTITVIQK